MKREIHILMLEDDAADAELTQFALRKGGVNFSVARVETRAGYLQELERRRPSLILSDYSLPGFNGHAALSIAQEKCPDTPFIFVTGTMGEEVAIETLKSGATDYVLKSRLSRLMPAVTRALREAHERAEHRRADEELRESHQKLRALSVYLQTVREEERTRIAREVHDELGQALTSCKLDLSWMTSKLPRELRPLVQKARELTAHIDSTIETVRRISSELRPGVLDHLGLAAALEWQAAEFQNRTGMKCEVRSSLREQMLEQDLSTTLFRIFQETLTNIIRHAGATRVSVRLKERHGRIILEVKDNGRGITRDEIVNSTSMGLLGMRERAALRGGSFHIGPLPHGQGTVVTVSIPKRQRWVVVPLGRQTKPGLPSATHPEPSLPRQTPNTKHENTLSRRSRRSAGRVEANSGR